MEICIFQSKLKKLKKQFSLSYTLGKRNFEKTSYIFSKEREATFRARKMEKPSLEKLLIFQEMRLFNPKHKKLLFFRRTL